MMTGKKHCWCNSSALVDFPINRAAGLKSAVYFGAVLDRQG